MEIEYMQLKPRRLMSIIVFVVIFLGLIFYYFQYTKGQEIKVSNLKYGSNQKQALDIYTPKDQNSKKLPVIIYAHGGGWRGGDKTNVSAKPAFFTKKGYAFVSINYRLYPEATYEEMANDVSDAIKWVYDNAYKYHFDRTKITLMGHSAGGHLMMLVAANPDYLSRIGLSAENIHSIVNIEGPLDLPGFINRFGTYKKVFGSDQKVWETASPVTYAATKNLPPMFLIAQGKMSVEPFMSTTKKAGNTVGYFQVNNLSHSQSTQFLGTSHNKEAANMTKAVVKFLKKY